MVVFEKKSERVYRWLLAYIDENKFSGNQKLPSENSICRILQVSRDTARMAIQRLVNEGVVYKVKGSGTYFRLSQVLTKDLSCGDAPCKIGLILQGQDRSANSGLIEGIRSAFDQDSIDLHIFLTDNKLYNERQCLQTVVHQNFQGFIVDGVKASIINTNLDCYKELYRRKIPVIFYNNYYRGLKSPKVIVKDAESADFLIGRLVNAGHKRIAGIFVYDNYQSVEKYQGMISSLRKRNLEIKDHYIKWCISDEAHSDRYSNNIERFLVKLPKCTAIVCCNYIIYNLVRKALEHMGKTVPNDYSVVCFDYSADDYEKEGITCTLEQGFTMGRQLAFRIMKMIENRDCDEKEYTAILSPIIYEGKSIKNINIQA